MNNVATLAEIRPTSAIDLPDTKVSAREAFEIDTDMQVPAFSVRTEHVPDIDTAYKFPEMYAFRDRVCAQAGVEPQARLTHHSLKGARR